MSADVIQYPDKNQRNLKVCRFCEKAISGEADILRENRQELAMEERPILGHAHPTCAREYVIAQQSARAAAAESLAAALVEAAGGSVLVSRECIAAIEARGSAELKVFENEDGSFRVSRPTLILNPNFVKVP